MSATRLAPAATHWKNIFHFAGQDAEKSPPLASMADRNAVTNNSRPTTTTATQGAMPDSGRSAARKMNVPQMMILSTKGSRMRHFGHLTKSPRPIAVDPVGGSGDDEDDERGEEEPVGDQAEDDDGEHQGGRREHVGYVHDSIGGRRAHRLIPHPLFFAAKEHAPSLAPCYSATAQK